MLISTEIKKLCEDANSRVKAYATVTIDDAIEIQNVKIVEGSKGLFASLPQRGYTDKNGDKKYADIISVKSPDVRNMINNSVVETYKSAVQEDIEQPLEQSM